MKLKKKNKNKNPQIVKSPPFFFNMLIQYYFRSFFFFFLFLLSRFTRRLYNAPTSIWKVFTITLFSFSFIFFYVHHVLYNIGNMHCIRESIAVSFIIVNNNKQNRLDNIGKSLTKKEKEEERRLVAEAENSKIGRVLQRKNIFIDKRWMSACCTWFTAHEKNEVKYKATRTHQQKKNEN